MEHTSRRSFVRLTGAAVGGSMFVGVGTGFAERTTPLVDGKAAGMVRRATTYAKRRCIYGGAIAGNANGVSGSRINAIVEMVDTQAFVDFAERQLSDLGVIHVNGNAFSFENDGITYVIENVSTEDFDAVMTEISNGEGELFSHETLGYDIESKILIDRFAQANSVDANGKLALTVIPHDCGEVEAFPCTFDASIDASLFGMSATSESDELVRRVTSSTVSNGEDARAIVTATIDRIAAAAETLEPAEVAAWVASPIVDSAFKIVQGRSSRSIARAFPGVARQLSTFDAPSVWLALLAGAVNDGGAIHRAAYSDDPYYSDRTRSAMTDAQTILRQERLPANVDLPTENASRFEDWMSDRFGAIATITGNDFDNDGVPNLVEYALGGDPTDLRTAPSPVPGSQTLDGETFLTLTYVRDPALTDIEYVTQASSSLVRDEWTTDDVIDEIVAVEGNLELRRARVKQQGGERYLRLLIRKV